MIGSNLKELRENKGIGVNELARLSNVNASYISAIERGEKSNPSMNTLNKIANALEVPVEELFKPENTELDNSKNTDDEEFDEEIMVLARNMKNLSPQKRKMLSLIIKTMSEEADKALEE